MRCARWCLVVALMLPVAACGADGPDGPGAARVESDVGTPTGADTSAPSDQASVDTDAARAATVSIRARGCGPRTRFGVGTVIDQGLVVTVAHVVAGADDIEIVGADGGSTAQAVFFDPELDVALLRTVDGLGSPIELRSSGVAAGDAAAVILPRLGAELPDEGDSTVALGVLDVTIARPVTIRTTDIYRATDVERPGFEVTATIEPGDSGAMVHTADGGAGLVWARSNERADRAWAVDLPPVLFDDDELRGLVDPVDVQRCVD